jgi:hypothetical protein
MDQTVPWADTQRDTLIEKAEDVRLAEISCRFSLVRSSGSSLSLRFMRINQRGPPSLATVH